MATQIWYHAHCMDGLGAAWAAHNHFKDSAVYIPVQYGDPYPEVRENDSIFILDFSYPREVLMEIAAKAGWVTVIDHHKTAQKDLERFSLPNVTIDFNMEYSGAFLAWALFMSYEKNFPTLIYYVQDRDLWKWELPHSKEVSAYLGHKNWSIEDLYNLEVLVESALEEVVAMGSVLLAYQDTLVDRIANNVFLTEIDGVQVPTVYSPVFQSELGDKISVGHPFAAVIMVLSETEEVVSLRSQVDGADVGVIAKKFGGGGHVHAAGFKRSK